MQPEMCHVHGDSKSRDCTAVVTPSACNCTELTADHKQGKRSVANPYQKVVHSWMPGPHLMDDRCGRSYHVVLSCDSHIR